MRHLVLKISFKDLYFFLFIFSFGLLVVSSPISAATEANTPISKSFKELSNNEILEKMAANLYTLHIIPGYKSLYESSQVLHSSMVGFCSDQNVKNYSKVKDNFADTVLSFAAIEHIHFGPIVDKYRLERLVYWPDHKGRGLRAVRHLLKAQDKNSLAPEKFVEKSIAVQGLTALEYVLYGNGKNQTFQELFTADEKGRFRCDYAKRLTANIQDISHKVYEEWQKQTPLIKELLNPALANEHYRNRKEVLLEFYQSVTVEMKKIHDLKIRALFGRKGKRSKPKRAPFWRSGLTLKVIKTNIETMDFYVQRSGFKSLLDRSPVDLQFHVSKMFLEIYASFKDFDKGSLTIFSIMADETSKEKLQKIAKTVSHLNVGFARYFALAADLPLGFNASDGD